MYLIVDDTGKENFSFGINLSIRPYFSGMQIIFRKYCFN